MKGLSFSSFRFLYRRMLCLKSVTLNNSSWIRESLIAWMVGDQTLLPLVPLSFTSASFSGVCLLLLLLLTSLPLFSFTFHLFLDFLETILSYTPADVFHCFALSGRPEGKLPRSYAATISKRSTLLVITKKGYRIPSGADEFRARRV